jgi:hypothetical protein
MPFDPNNPPAKLSKLSPKKQRQWVHVFNSCYSKTPDDKKCHMMAWGAVKKSAKLLPDYGMTKAIMEKLRLPLDRMTRLIEIEDAKRLSRISTSVGGKVSDLADSTIPPEFKEYLDKEKYRWDVKFGTFMGDFLKLAQYNPHNKIILIYFNTALPLSIGKYFWRKKDKALRDLEKTDVTVRHELTHLLRDAQTGHLKREVDKRKVDRQLQEKYLSRGHQEMEFEIDAIINGMDELRRRIGDERFDELTPKDLERMMVVKFPRDTKTLSKWVKRLMREGMLTTGMRKEWRLGKTAFADVGVDLAQGCGCTQTGDCGCTQTHSVLPTDSERIVEEIENARRDVEAALRCRG